MRVGRKTILFLLLGLGLLGLLAYGGYQLGLRRWGLAHWQAAAAALDRRDFPRATDHLRECLRLWPTDPEVLLLAAQMARRQGDAARAREWLQRGEEHGLPPEALSLERRLLRVQAGDLSEADRLLAFCTQHPEAAEAPLTLEALLTGCERHLPPLFEATPADDDPGWQRLLAGMRQALDLWLQRSTTPAARAQGLYWRGRLHGATAAYPLAVADFRAALELDPDHFEAHLQLALAIAQEAPRETAEHLEILHRRAPRDRRVRFWLATVRRSLGQPDEAARLLDELLATSPDDVPALVERGLVALDRQQPAEAEPLLRRALVLAPELPEAHLALSRCLQAAGQPKEARQRYERFLELEAKRRPPS